MIAAVSKAIQTRPAPMAMPATAPLERPVEDVLVGALVIEVDEPSELVDGRSVL
jgi:hypothetical protein